jgi:signal transduction histidine kinase
VHEVLRTGRGEFAASIPEELLQSVSLGDEHLRLLRELGLRSYMIVPLRTRTQIFGAITFVTAESGRRYDADDLAVAEDLALRASQAIENARLFREVEESRELLEQQAVELEQQAEEVEHAAAELEESNEALQRTNDELAQRSYEAERARQEAEVSRSEAVEANRAKSDFLASMSHELRTPLNAIMGYAQLMEIGVHGAVSPPQREDLNRIDRSAQHLLGLINDILNFAKIERGSVSYSLERVAIADVLVGVEDLVGPQARAKQLEYRFRNECPGILVCADREKLMQIFVNLLSNAVHFTAEGGSIEIACSATADRVVTRVIDTGVGIPHDKLDAIFEPFVQVERVYSGQRSGTGLGLAISRALARGMGGDLTVTTELGKGSEFALTLKRET